MSLQQVCFKVFYVWDNISIPQFVLVKIAALMRIHQPFSKKQGLSTESVPFGAILSPFRRAYTLTAGLNSSELIFEIHGL